jgi:AcrR family transcriptional regulator
MAKSTSHPGRRARNAVLDPDGIWSGRRRRQDHDTKRDTVIRTAARAFNERGYHNTSLDDIAATLGVTKPTIYYYVPNKEQLLFECFQAGLVPIREALRRAELAGGSSRDRLRDVVRDYALAIASDYGWCMVRAEHQDLGPELGGRIRALKSEIDQGIRRLLADGQRDGSITIEDPKLASFAIAGALNWIAHWYRPDQSLSAAAVADSFVRLLEHGLAPRTPAAIEPSATRRGQRKSG